MKITRPRPPDTIGQIIGSHPLNVMPALDMPLWALQTFLEPNSRLFNQDHYHLYDHIQNGNIQFLWSAGNYIKAGNQVIGLTEQVVFRCSYWQKVRQEQQMMEWFGLQTPEYVITLDAGYCLSCSDAEFCALVEHELYHISHEYNEFDMPKFHRDSGLPMLKIRGHDVEEFIGVVRRYGAGHPDSRLSQLVKAANNMPEIAKVDIAHACGNCLKLVA